MKTYVKTITCRLKSAFNMQYHARTCMLIKLGKFSHESTYKKTGLKRKKVKSRNKRKKNIQLHNFNLEPARWLN